MKKKIFMVTLLLLFFVAIVSAQSADAVTKMIESKEATVGEAAYFLAVYLDAAPENSTEEAAVNALQASGVCNEGVAADTVLTYKTFAGMLMRTWDVKGGLMYSITKADRYALRDLQAKGFISASADPVSAVSGFDALAILNNCMTQLGGN